jgi:hypothetical protein
MPAWPVGGHGCLGRRWGLEPQMSVAMVLQTIAYQAPVNG